MQERLRLLGGELTIQSNGNGTSVFIELPIKPEVVISSNQHAPDITARSANT
jgi:signal transduction histidine kinase